MTPPGGRKPATRGVFALEAQELLLPNPMALDTSFVVEALIATQPLHGVCRAFLKRIDEDGVSVATSELLRFELAEAVFAIALKERWGGQWRRHRTDGRARRRAVRLLNDTLTRYDEILGAVRHISIPLGDTANLPETFMIDYGIASYGSHPVLGSGRGSHTSKKFSKEFETCWFGVVAGARAWGLKFA